MPVYTIPENQFIFPHPALAQEDGLLGIGGDLQVERILLAYQNGIFPWYSAGEPILWWCITPRLVLYPENISISKSMHSYFNQSKFTLSFDKDFLSVILQCKTSEREGQGGSWIHQEIIDTFLELHAMGIAHSVEVWKDEYLVGGLYGLAIGKIFCGESMFSKTSNASKFALIHLAKFLQKKNFNFIDCQQDTPHLRTMGAELISKKRFFDCLEENKNQPILQEKWSL
ncbi:MAG: leucyl/phenylalanyl-tRNA--protein transferase [Saprospiraceae bacterium]|nr:leucyl/phenylalanyl-tRNA--protein transferase [Saprospiraceae bacterium]